MTTGVVAGADSFRFRGFRARTDAEATRLETLVVERAELEGLAGGTDVGTKAGGTEITESAEGKEAGKVAEDNESVGGMGGNEIEEMAAADVIGAAARSSA